MRRTSLANARATLDSGQAPREGRRHSSQASSVRAAYASRRGGTSEPLSSRMACIARSSDTSAGLVGEVAPGRGFGPLVLFGVVVERSHSAHKGLFREPKPG
jgi:hypothetical protein